MKKGIKADIEIPTGATKEEAEKQLNTFKGYLKRRTGFFGFIDLLWSAILFRIFKVKEQEVKFVILGTANLSRIRNEADRLASIPGFPNREKFKKIANAAEEIIQESVEAKVVRGEL